MTTPNQERWRYKATSTGPSLIPLHDAVGWPDDGEELVPAARVQGLEAELRIKEGARAQAFKSWRESESHLARLEEAVRAADKLADAMEAIKDADQWSDRLEVNANDALDEYRSALTHSTPPSEKDR